MAGVNDNGAPLDPLEGLSLVQRLAEDIHHQAVGLACLVVCLFLVNLVHIIGHAAAKVYDHLGVASFQFADGQALGHRTAQLDIFLELAGLGILHVQHQLPADKSLGHHLILQAIAVHADLDAVGLLALHLGLIGFEIIELMHRGLPCLNAALGQHQHGKDHHQEHRRRKSPAEKLAHQKDSSLVNNQRTNFRNILVSFSGKFLQNQTYSCKRRKASASASAVFSSSRLISILR